MKFKYKFCKTALLISAQNELEMTNFINYGALFTLSALVELWLIMKGHYTTYAEIPGVPTPQQPIFIRADLVIARVQTSW